MGPAKIDSRTAATPRRGRWRAIQCSATVSVDYRLDPDDRITFLGGSWNEFARSNGAPNLVDDPLGRSVWDYVAGAETAFLWGEVLRRARETNAVLMFPFRCDSPRERRFLMMAVQAVGDGAVELVSETQRVEARVAADWLESTVRRGAWMISSCSWCRKFEVEGEWVEVEEAVAHFDSFAGNAPEITHGVCPTCAAALRAELLSPTHRGESG
jgi:hypothetical protein